MSSSRDLDRPAAGDLDAFLGRASLTPRLGDAAPRLLFALDATASRRPTWELAARLHGEMAEAARGLGGLQLQLAWFRGHREFSVGPWLAGGAGLAEAMGRVDCRAGQTQVGRVLAHAVGLASEAAGLAALIYIGDSMEEDPATLYRHAGELALRRAPVFAFLEGDDAAAERSYAEIARLSGGALCPFDRGSASQLAELLRAVATYAAGGHAALARLDGPAARHLLAQLPAAGAR